MANDSQDLSRRKHRRSDDGESEESSRHRNHLRSDDDESEERSKRRKHRHRRHHHRRHHRDGSKKDGEDESKNEEEINPKDDEPEGRVGDEVKVIPSFCPVLISNYYDMEEGEIVEDVELDYQNMGVNEIQDGQEPCPGLPSKIAESVNRNSMTLQEENIGANLMAKISVDGKENMCDADKLHRNVDSKIRSSSKCIVNGDSEQKYRKEDYMPQKVGNFFIEESGKPRSYYSEKDDLRDPRKFSSMDEWKRHGTWSCSPSRERHREESHIKNRSRSSGRTRERSQSQNIHFHPDASLILSENKKTDRKQKLNSDDERTIDSLREYRHGNRDLSREKETDQGSSYSRHSHGRETWDIDKEGSREIPDRHRDGSEEICDRARDGSREIRGRDRNGSKDIRDRGREGSRDIHDRGREGSRDIRDRGREGSRDIRDRGRKGKEMNRDSRRSKEQNWEREMVTERDHERVRERDHERLRERDHERDRERDYDRDREREWRRERGRDRDRDYEKESEIVARHHKYDHTDNGRRDPYRSNDLRRKRHEEKYRNYKNSKNDAERVRGLKNLTGEVSDEKHGIGEYEQEDFQENISMQLAEQEEEDLNRIKEESRRRTQAILEKYKAQRQHRLHSNDKVEEHIERHPDKVAAIKVVLEDGGVQNEGAEIYVVDPSFSLGKSPQTGPFAIERTSGTRGLGEGTPKSEKSDDMFCDDIFGESPAGVRKSGKGEGLAIERSGLHDNWDDAEGYYNYHLGEILDGQYEVTAAHGKGVFSTVVRAKDLKAGSGVPEEVAIKIIRSNDTMYKAGLEELVILKKLMGADPEDKRHCVRFISSFKYHNHLCLVFESLHMNLREVLKKFGRNIGLKLTAVRAYAKQLFIALKHLRNCGVLHCDIKPDNMLVNEAKNVLKLCDFGNAMLSGKNEITPYLVSRFYRAPEIILGLHYDHPMDMWSVGCCLFELYTGRVLFPGPTNNDMLRLHMELKGPFPKKMLRKGSFTDHHFDQDLNFLATEEDPITKKAIKRLILNIKPKDVGTLISGSPGEDPKMLANFKDLLEKIFVLDPDKRITVSQALSLPFITGK